MPAETSTHDAGLEQWIGRAARASERLRPEPARFMQATLDLSLIHI